MVIYDEASTYIAYKSGFKLENQFAMRQTEKINFLIYNFVGTTPLLLKFIQKTLKL